MPLLQATKHLPGATRYVRAQLTGKVTAHDARLFTRLLTPGQPMYGVPLLAVVEQNSELDEGARRALSSLVVPSVGLVPRVAMVVASVPLRGMLSFLIRMWGLNRATRFFDSEPEAQAWLLAAAQLA